MSLTDWWFGRIYSRFDALDARIAGLEVRLGIIGAAIGTLLEKGGTMAADLKSLQAQVKANTDAEASAVVLIQGIAAQLAEAKEDPAAIQALADQLKASGDALAQAVIANTPAA